MRFIKAKLSLCTCAWNKQRDMWRLFDQSIRKQTQMQKAPCDGVCVDQTASNHQRANNKLLFLWRAAVTAAPSIRLWLCLFSQLMVSQASPTLLCLVQYLQALHYCEDEGGLSLKTVGILRVRITNTAILMCDFFLKQNLKFVPIFLVVWLVVASFGNMAVLTLFVLFISFIFGPWLCSHVGRCLTTMDEVCNIFFFSSLLLLVSAFHTLCTRVLPSNNSVLFVLSSSGTPPLQKNNVLEGKPNQCAGRACGINSVFFSYLI